MGDDAIPTEISDSIHLRDKCRRRSSCAVDGHIRACVLFQGRERGAEAAHACRSERVALLAKADGMTRVDNRYALDDILSRE